MLYSIFEFEKILQVWKKMEKYMKSLKHSFVWANLGYISLHQADEIWLSNRDLTYL